MSRERATSIEHDRTCDKPGEKPVCIMPTKVNVKDLVKRAEREREEFDIAYIMPTKVNVKDSVKRAELEREEECMTFEGERPEVFHTIPTKVNVKDSVKRAELERDFDYKNLNQYFQNNIPERY